MPAFKFNFSVEEDEQSIRTTPSQEHEVTSPKEVSVTTSQRTQVASQQMKWLDSEEIIVTSQLKALDSVIFQDVTLCTVKHYIDLVIKHIIVSKVAQIANPLLLKHSDLDEGVYEGGLKIWECTNDLIEYLLMNVDKEQWKGANVLDLGCGTGLVGIMALLNGSRVVFQDYNKEVLECTTIQNCLLNFNKEDREMAIQNCRFFSGDWDSFNSLLEESDQFDYILTSETIYNTGNYKKIINILKSRLKDKGVAYVAAKTCYFGVGGGMRQFETALEQADFRCEVCWKDSEGVSREILKVTKNL